MDPVVVSQLVPLDKNILILILGIALAGCTLLGGALVYCLVWFAKGLWEKIDHLIKTQAEIRDEIMTEIRQLEGRVIWLEARAGKGHEQQ